MDLSIPRLVEQIIDQGINKNNLNVVLTTSAIMFGITLLDTLVAIGSSIYSVRVGQSVSRDIRKAIFLKIQKFSYGNLDRFSTGKLMVRMTNDADAVQRFVQISLRIGASAPLTLIGSIILMYLTNRQLALSLMPLLTGYFGRVGVFQHKDGAILSSHPGKTGLAEYRPAGKYRWFPAGESLRAQRT